MAPTAFIWAGGGPTRRIEHDQEKRGMTITEVVDFWRDAGPSRWFRKDPAFDTLMRTRFLALHEAAVRGVHDDWPATPEGALALLILLDQFPRNAFRESPRMFASDAKALGITRAAIAAGFDERVDPALRNFFYLPFMHSEQLQDQDVAARLTRGLGGEQHRFALLHRGIIEKFGRFPHRNAQLGRTTTAAEQEFLDAGGFAG